MKSVHRSTERRHFPKTTSETYFRQSKVLLNALKRCLNFFFLSFWSFPRPSEPFGIHQGRAVIFLKIFVDIFLRLRKREISWYLFPSLFSKKKNLRVLAFTSNSQIRTYKSDLTLNKDAEFNQNMFSTKLGARSVYKFIMIIKLPIRCLGCAAHQLQCTLTKLGHRINLNLFVVCKHQALPSRGGLELDK